MSSSSPPTHLCFLAISKQHLQNMSQLHTPPISIEDLESFQAKHFPTSTLTPSPLQSQPQLQPDIQNDKYSSYGHDPFEDDLGYYPDGVKRTLTDEQIRIFRHSEIHALLRERQVKAENEEYESKFGADTAEAQKSESTSPKIEFQSKSSTKEDVRGFGTGVGAKRPADESGLNTQSGKKKSAVLKNKGEAEDVRLDYNEQEETVATKPTASRVQPPAQFPGRRIISYDD
ncbi:hypothetical protein BJX70DRAFT_267209 [Aspergillus crustosus]